MTMQELFAKPDSWCQDYLALDAAGKETHEDDPEACRWCLIGAFLKCHRDPETRYRLRVKLENEIQSMTGDKQDNIVEYNNASERTIKDIRRLVKVAGV